MAKKDKNLKDDFQPRVVKQKILRINPMALISMLMTGNKIGVKDGVPAGSRYVGSGYDASTHTFFVNVENDRFDEVEVGEKLVPLDIYLEDLNAKEKK